MKKLLSIALCLIMLIPLLGCRAHILDDTVLERLLEESRAAYEERHAAGEGSEGAIRKPNGADREDAPDADADLPLDLDNHRLNTTSPEAFIREIKLVYTITLVDELDLLSGHDGPFMMRQIDYGLSLFSPRFVRNLVALYSEYESDFQIVLESPSEEEYGDASWSEDFIITLHYDSDPYENGVRASVLAHEMAHAAHFIIEEIIGLERSESEMRAFNGAHDYVGGYYSIIWDETIHGFYFAYDYGMYDYYEDIATVIEKLVESPDMMYLRLSDLRHEPLFRKTSYIREMFYEHISNACKALFAPLYQAEYYWQEQAA